MKKFTYPFYLIWRHNIVFFNEIHLRKARNTEGTKLSVWKSTLKIYEFSVYTVTQAPAGRLYALLVFSTPPDCEELLAAWCRTAGVQNTLRVSWLHSWSSRGFQGTHMRSHTLSCPVLSSFALYSTALPCFRGRRDCPAPRPASSGVCSALTLRPSPAQPDFSQSHCSVAFSLSNHAVLPRGLKEHRAQQHSLVCPGHFCPALPFLHDIYH